MPRNVGPCLCMLIVHERPMFIRSMYVLSVYVLFGLVRAYEYLRRGYVAYEDI